MRFCVLDSHFRGNDGMQVRGNDEVEVTRNLKQAKPNELDSHFRGNDVVQVRGNDGM
ncbi:hypothetical protein H8A07_10565 [Neisseria meningitidis]|nr:hypothetical protein [Neisseria meningitidis]